MRLVVQGDDRALEAGGQPAKPQNATGNGEPQADGVDAGHCGTTDRYQAIAGFGGRTKVAPWALSLRWWVGNHVIARFGVVDQGGYRGGHRSPSLGDRSLRERAEPSVDMVNRPKVSLAKVLGPLNDRARRPAVLTTIHIRHRCGG
ncbi:hypothetical protein MMIN_27490 [Mycolicibacter minnesotensis]|nr:hypothetical protein MMIN_27490 [Mycolicibacter minnesotensis]